jgi:S1-C subfamily serine protease
MGFRVRLCRPGTRRLAGRIQFYRPTGMSLLTWRTILPIALGTTLFSGCLQPPPYSAEDRTQSFKALQSSRIGSESLQQFLFARDAGILTGATVARFEPDGKFTVATSSGRLAYGTASAIDRRGYFITAGHATTGTPLNLFWQDDGDCATATWHHAVARIVWRSPPGDKMDLAVLWVPAALSSVFRWADEPLPGEVTAATGAGSGAQGELRGVDLTPLGGTVTATAKHEDRTPHWLEVRHSTPLYFGDSGGPLANTRGELLAINTGIAAEIQFLPYSKRYHAIAGRPDTDWLRKVVDDDWRLIGAKALAAAQTER